MIILLLLSCMNLKVNNIEKGPREDEKLFVSVSRGNIEEVEKNLREGANIDTKDSGGWTPLHIAAFYGHKEVAEILISKGANIEVKTILDETAFDIALDRGHADIAVMLRNVKQHK